MSDIPARENNTQIIKKLFPEGTTIELINLHDRLAKLPPGSQGIVLRVDDIGQIHIKWQSDLILALIPGVDSFIKIK